MSRIVWTRHRLPWASNKRTSAGPRPLAPGPLAFVHIEMAMKSSQPEVATRVAWVVPLPDPQKVPTPADSRSGRRKACRMRCNALRPQAASHTTNNSGLVAELGPVVKATHPDSGLALKLNKNWCEGTIMPR